MTTRYHCDACGWEGEDPVLNEIQGSGCGGVLWTLRACPKCGEEVYQTVIPREGGEAIG
jgi:predicted RNA-binding Zn-ribbon protein involved in translation (DUF1610 family)